MGPTSSSAGVSLLQSRLRNAKTNCYCPICSFCVRRLLCLYRVSGELRQEFICFMLVSGPECVRLQAVKHYSRSPDLDWERCQHCNITGGEEVVAANKHVPLDLRSSPRVPAASSALSVVRLNSLV